MAPRKTPGSRAGERGKLRIGDDWNAITIIALSQPNPLKAIAELVENSIDARASRVTITRGREHGRHFLSIRDDGDGVPRERAGSGAPGANGAAAAGESSDEAMPGAPEPELGEERQRQFFEYAGPLFSVTISPASSIVRVGESRELRALPRDRSRRRVEQDLEFLWRIAEGAGAIENPRDQAVRFIAAAEPGLTRVCVTVRQGDVVCETEALVTVTHELLPQLGAAAVEAQGLPGYTFERAAGESWRSKFDTARNLIVINNGHRDFVYAGRSKGLKLRYLVRLYAKELVLRNFVGLPSDQLLERMVELSLRTEEHL